ncbi:hypothetical protein BC936DRAFT_145694, partial [Jimgerdemannia flammicorona]
MSADSSMNANWNRSQGRLNATFKTSRTSPIGDDNKERDISLGQKRPCGTIHGDENDESDRDDSPCESAKKRLREPRKPNQKKCRSAR